MKKIYKFLFILIFVISSFLFINDVKADYEAIVVNPAGSKCELYSKATGKCFYKNENNYICIKKNKTSNNNH
jgi:hypothetical protein